MAIDGAHSTKVEGAPLKMLKYRLLLGWLSDSAWLGKWFLDWISQGADVWAFATPSYLPGKPGNKSWAVWVKLLLWKES
jgi:hypothetical protein